MQAESSAFGALNQGVLRQVVQSVAHIVRHVILWLSEKPVFSGENGFLIHPGAQNDSEHRRAKIRTVKHAERAEGFLVPNTQNSVTQIKRRAHVQVWGVGFAYFLNRALIGKALGQLLYAQPFVGEQSKQ